MSARLRRAALIGCALLVTASAAAVAAHRPPPKPQHALIAGYDAAYARGSEAFEYGVPLLDAQRVYLQATRDHHCDPLYGSGPANSFCSLRDLATPQEKGAPGPNRDTLYSSAWLTNLSRAPEVITAPAIRDRFWEFELIDPWTNNFYNITSIATPEGPGSWGVTRGGAWAIAGPGFHGRVPKGVTLVRSRWDRVWVAGRTFVRGDADVPRVRRITAQYRVVPLSRWSRRASYRPSKDPRPNPKLVMLTIPGTAPGEDPLDFYRELGREMQRFPAPRADAAQLARLRAIGVGPGLDPAKADLDADALRGLRDAVTKGHANLLAAFLHFYLQGFDKHNGWVITDLGAWGTNYALRAISDAIGIGGQRAEIALYPAALLDATRAPLTSAKRYVLHIAAKNLPVPVSAFWSLTLYDQNSYFVANPLNRYALNRFSNLHRNADGSIDLFVQPTRPSNADQAANWLPSPTQPQPIRLIFRLYGLGGALRGTLDGRGWLPPKIQPCDANGVGSAGTPCAR